VYVAHWNEASKGRKIPHSIHQVSFSETLPNSRTKGDSEVAGGGAYPPEARLQKVRKG
jgi:hypothetical protein